jgi:hypothetical protein
MDIAYLRNQQAKFEQIKERDEQADKSDWPVVFHAINNAALNVVKIFEAIIQSDIKEIAEGTRNEIARNLYFAKRLIGDLRNQSLKLADHLKDGADFDDLQETISDLNSDFDIASTSDEDSSHMEEMHSSLKEKPISPASLKYQNYYFINEGNRPSDCLELGEELNDDISLVQTRLLESFSVFGTMPQVALLESGARLEFDQENLEEFTASIFKIDFGPYGFQLKETEEGKRSFGLYVNDGYKIEGLNDETLKDLFEQSQLLDFDYEISKILADFTATNLEFRLSVHNHHRLNDHEAQEGEIFSYLSTSFQEVEAK